MVFVVHSTCGGTAVGVRKQGHTVVVVHDTCGGWRLVSGEGHTVIIIMCDTCGGWALASSRRGGRGEGRGTVVVVMRGTCGGTYLVCLSPSPSSLLQVVVHQWRMPKKKKGGGDLPRLSSLSPPPCNCPTRRYRRRCGWWCWRRRWCISEE